MGRLDRGSTTVLQYRRQVNILLLRFVRWVGLLAVSYTISQPITLPSIPFLSLPGSAAHGQLLWCCTCLWATVTAFNQMAQSMTNILIIFRVPYLKRKKQNPWRITLLSVCQSRDSLSQNTWRYRVKIKTILYSGLRSLETVKKVRTFYTAKTHISPRPRE